MLDEVAIYADALTPEAVQAHYNAFFAGDPPVITKQPQGGTYLAGLGADPQRHGDGTQPGLSVVQGHHRPERERPPTRSAFSSLAAGDAGTYSVTVSNVTATVTSSNAIIALAIAARGVGPLSDRGLK